jgi:uncharacterized protein (TIGR02646 family)
MVRLSRRGIKVPANWQQTVDQALPNAAKFHRKVGQFEQLDEQSQARVGGFAVWAPGVLPTPPGKTSPDFPPLWRDEPIKTPISTMSAGHCAYCQCPVSADHAGKVPGQVEHFKPKSRFPSLAYDVKNYFLSCEACNLTKHNKWPPGGYVRPDGRSPASRFAFDEDGTVRPARPRDAQAKKTIEDFGLNRPGLKEQRRVQIKRQMNSVRLALQLAKGGLKSEQLRKLIVPALSFVSEAINQNVQRACAGGARKRRVSRGAARNVGR